VVKKFMKKIVLLILGIIITAAVLMGCSNKISGKNAVMKWEKTFGGIKDDRSESIQQTIDGGYIIAGVTYSFGDVRGDIYLIKIDAGGNKLWERTLGGNNHDEVEAIQQTSDGGYIIAGSTNIGSFISGANDVYLIKTDAGGNKIWEKTFGGNKSDFATSIQQTIDGGYIIAGYTSSFGNVYPDIYLIKTDAGGNKLWEKTLGGNGDDAAHSIKQTVEGGYIIAGSTKSYGNGVNDVYLIKTDANGNRAWEKTFGGNSSDSANSIQQTSDRGYIIAGSTNSYGNGENDVYLIKTDAGGNRVWEKTFGGNSSDSANSIQQTSDRGYIIAGSTNSYGNGENDVYLIKTDAGGNRVWEKTFGGNSSDSANSIQQTSDRGYIIAGYTRSFGNGSGDVYIIKTDENGNVF
jgi:hypothetical protein